MDSTITITLHKSSSITEYANFKDTWERLQNDSDIKELHAQFVAVDESTPEMYLTLQDGETLHKYSDHSLALTCENIKAWILHKDHMSLSLKSRAAQLVPDMSTTTKIGVGAGIGGAFLLITGLVVANHFSKSKVHQPKPFPNEDEDASF